MLGFLGEVLGAPGVEETDVVVMFCDAVWNQISEFRRDILCLSSGLKY